MEAGREAVQGVARRGNRQAGAGRGTDTDACGVDRDSVRAARRNADRIGGGAVYPRIRVAVKAIGRKGRGAERGQKLVREDRVAPGDVQSSARRRRADADIGIIDIHIGQECYAGNACAQFLDIVHLDRRPVGVACRIDAEDHFFRTGDKVAFPDFKVALDLGDIIALRLPQAKAESLAVSVLHNDVIAARRFGDIGRMRAAGCLEDAVGAG